MPAPLPMAEAKKYRYLMRLQYLGFRYHGWQFQTNAKTVQEKVEKTIRFVLGTDVRFKTLASGRTDALVSANEMPVELFICTPLANPQKFLHSFNVNLPADIRCLSIREVEAGFSVMSGAKVKEYIYLFSFGVKNHPFAAPFMVYLRDSLNIEQMQLGAQRFEGTHNFRRYCYKPNENSILERTILKCELGINDRYTASFFPEKSYLFRVVGKGFGRNQVRIMMGMLFELGRGKETLESLERSLLPDKEETFRYTAPASGLILDKVIYD